MGYIMNEGRENKAEELEGEKILKNFSTNIKTLLKVKQFQQDYQREKLSHALDDLVNIGLANLGYNTKEEIEDRFDDIELIVNPLSITKQE